MRDSLCRLAALRSGWSPTPVGVLLCRSLLGAGMVWAAMLAGGGLALAQRPAFTAVPGSPFGAGNAPHSVPFTPDGRLLAVVNYGSPYSVSVFSVGSDGNLSPEPAPSFATGSAPVSGAFSPSGGLLATANYGANTVSVFSVEEDGRLSPVTGSLTSSSFATGNGPYLVAFSPHGRLLATPNRASDTVSVFSVATNGRLSPEPARSFGTGSDPHSVAFSPAGTLLATANHGANTVSVFSVEEDGRLSPVTGSLTSSSFATGSSPHSVAFSHDGRLLATANRGSHTVSVFSVGEDGRLSPVTGSLTSSSFATGSSPIAAAFSPGGGLLASANSGSANASLFSVGSDGRLTPAAGSPFGVGTYPRGLAFSPRGLLAIANELSNTVSVFAQSTPPLEIDKATDRPEVAPGEELEYTITVTNPATAATAFSISSDLSRVLDRATYRELSADVGAATVNPTTRLLAWDGTLEPGQTATLRLSVLLDEEAEGMLELSVTGPPGSTCVDQAEPEPPCVIATPIVPPDEPGPDLRLRKSASTGTVHPGGQVTFALVVRNRGPGEARRVTVEDPAAAGLFFQRAEPSQGRCTITGRLRCRLGSLPAGGSALVLVSATVATNASGRIVNRAVVYGNRGDPSESSNTATSTVRVRPLPPLPNPDPGPQPVSDLVVRKHVDHRRALRGERLKYTIAVTNRGPDPAMRVRLSDTSSLPVRVLAIRPAQGRCRKRPPLRCVLGRLRAGARLTVRITAVATAAGSLTNAAAATSRSWDAAVFGSLATTKTRIIPRPTLPPGGGVTG